MIRRGKSTDKGARTRP